MTVKQWASELDIMHSPSMVFFNKNGKEVFRTEGYLKAFHTHSAMEYVSSKAYLEQPEFQRYVESRSSDIQARGMEVNLMK